MFIRQKLLLHGQCYGYVKYIFFRVYSFLFVLDLKGITNTLKSAMECSDIAAFTNMIRSCLLHKTISEITGMDNAILELCTSCDFFASPLIEWCGVYSNKWIIKECALRPSKTSFSPQTHLGTYVNLYSSERSMTCPLFAKPTLCKGCNQKRWCYAKNAIRNAHWEAIYHFRVNSSHISRNKIYSFPVSSLVIFFKGAVLRSTNILLFLVSATQLKIAVNHATWDVYWLSAKSTTRRLTFDT